MDTFEKTYSAKETAGLLGVSRDSVIRLNDGGFLPCVRLPRMGGRGRNFGRRFLESDIKRFIERNRR